MMVFLDFVILTNRGWVSLNDLNPARAEEQSSIATIIGHLVVLPVMSLFIQCTMGFHITFQEMEIFFFKLIL